MAEEVKVVLKRSEDSSFGFSLLGTSNLPHVIYDIIENSPAAECGVVEAGDVIVKVNGTDVHLLSTKEVLKFLRLSQDPVTLELKRDPKIKEDVQNYLDQNNHHYSDCDTTSSQSRSCNNTSASPHLSSPQLHHTNSTSRPSRIPTIVRSPVHVVSKHSAQRSVQNELNKLPQRQIPVAKANGNTSSNNSSHSSSHSLGTNHNGTTTTSHTNEPTMKKKSGFEAYMMTGDLILNLSRTQQTSGLTSHSKKIDSLRDSTKRSLRNTNAIAPYAKGETSSSSSLSENSDSSSNRHQHANDSDGKANRNVTMTKKSNDNNVVIDQLTEQNYDQRHQQSIDGGTKVSTPKSLSRKIPVKVNNTPDHVDCSSVNRRFDDVPSEALHAMAKGSKGRLIDHKHLSSSSGSSSPTRSSPSSVQSSTPPPSSSASSSTTSATDKSNSMPTSPSSLPTPIADALHALKNKEASTSVPTSPETSAQDVVQRRNQQTVLNARKCDASGFRTSRSEDHLQHTQRDMVGSSVRIDADEDVNSSLNTLLDTRGELGSSPCTSDRDRIVWTYNAPVTMTMTSTTMSAFYQNSQSFSSSISSSPQHSGDSLASPTSVSSSIMSSNSGSKDMPHVIAADMPSQNATYSAMNGNRGGGAAGTDLSVSEAVSNISSPDYQDDENLMSARDIAAMAISDASDSDSTLLASDMNHRNDGASNDGRGEHKIVIRVKGMENQTQHSIGYAELRDSEDELATITEDVALSSMAGYDNNKRDASPPVSDDGSDVDSLHSYHYSPKAVDIPSAVRLAKRLYGLEGFKKSDVSRHLSKNNDFSRAVAEEYLRYFGFEKLKLDEALRLFLKQFSLSGETQERERVLVHFSRRYLDCNPGTFNSQDAVHTLTCAIMLLNTDLHGQNIGRKMTCSEFIENLADLNDGENFSKDILKYLYQAIKEHPLEWALDDNFADQKGDAENNVQRSQTNPLMDFAQSTATAVEYKKGYVMRKCCFDANYKKTPFGKRSWKMFYCTLRDSVLYLHKDENGFRKSQMSDNVHNTIRIHHALAAKATDYKKKQYVFRLQTADQAEFLFQTSDSKELQSWIDTINFVCASLSAPPLEGGVGSQKRFQRPLLPSSHTKLLLRDQLASHETKVAQLEDALREHTHKSTPTKGLSLQNYVEKDNYLQYELKRYKTYVYVLNSHMLAEQQQNSYVQHDEAKMIQPNCVTSTKHSSGNGAGGGGGGGINNRTATIYNSDANENDE